MIRVIPRIDVKNDWLVKGVHLEGLRAIGNPAVFAKAYYEAGADEIFFMDVVASLYERNSLLDLVSSTASQIFIPLTVGGGLRSEDDIRRALSAGADKVSINTAAMNKPGFISAAANRFGSSTIVVTLEVIRQMDGTYHCYTDNGRERTGREAVAWAKQAQALGAGELLVTSVDRDGTGRGFEIEIIRQIADAVTIPVIAHGGAGGVDHVAQMLQADCNVSAVCLASMLHYHLARELGQDQPINAVHARPGMKRGKVEDIGLEELKRGLAARHLPVRVPTKQSDEPWPALR
jgi:imidazole glycerol-phosphate synthase subunit HisF